MRKKVFVGLSGGVDSAVSASLLKEQGYEVTGVFMKNWSNEDYGIDDNCPWKEDLDDTLKVCEALGIEHKTYNFEKEYRKLVIENFFEEYERGNTPNPDVLCNKFIKFDYFMKRCLNDGADMIATGHYSRTENGKLYKAKDKNKDQTYFLHQLTKEQLEKTLFPLAQFIKPEVRKLAVRFNLPVANKKDSQGICFVGKVDIKDFLKTRLQETTGDIVDIDTNKVVGKHRGVWFYTLGQRKGIEIGGLSEPYFVCKKDRGNNTLYVAKGKQNPALWSNTIKIKALHLIDPKVDLSKLSGLSATIRYRSTDKNGDLILKTKDEGIFIFEEKQWTPTPGQSLVLFHGDECLGGGLIC